MVHKKQFKPVFSWSTDVNKLVGLHCVYGFWDQQIITFDWFKLFFVTALFLGGCGQLKPVLTWF